MANGKHSLIHVSRTPGIFYQYKEYWLSHLTDTGEQPKVVDLEEAVDICQRLGVKLSVRPVPSWEIQASEPVRII